VILAILVPGCRLPDCPTYDARGLRDAIAQAATRDLSCPRDALDVRMPFGANDAPRSYIVKGCGLVALYDGSCEDAGTPRCTCDFPTVTLRRCGSAAELAGDVTQAPVGACSGR
jgi:hypothetical protein